MAIGPSEGGAAGRGWRERNQAGKRLTGRVEIDDASLGGGRSGGKRRRGAPGKTPIIVAMETDAEGQPVRLKLSRVDGFRGKEVEGGPGAASIPPAPSSAMAFVASAVSPMRDARVGRIRARLRPHGGAAARLQVGQHRARRHRDRHHRHLAGHPPATHPPLPGRIRLPLRSTLRSRRHDAASRLSSHSRPAPRQCPTPPQIS